MLSGTPGTSWPSTNEVGRTTTTETWTRPDGTWSARADWVTKTRAERNAVLPTAELRCIALGGLRVHVAESRIRIGWLRDSSRGDRP